MADIRSYRELRVYQAAMDAAMRIFELSKRFPVEERIDRSSSKVLKIRLFEHWRGVAKTPLPRCFC